MLDPAGFVCVISTFFVYLSCNNYMSFLWAQRICTIQLHCLGHLKIFALFVVCSNLQRSSERRKYDWSCCLGWICGRTENCAAATCHPVEMRMGALNSGWGGALGWALRGGEVLVASAVLREGSRLVTQSPYLQHCHMCGEWEDVSPRAGDRVSPSYGMSHHEYLKIGKGKQNICHLKSFRDGILRIPAY